MGAPAQMLGQVLFMFLADHTERVKHRPACELCHFRHVSGRHHRLGSMGGQTMVEFAFVVIIFFLFVFAVLDFGRLFFVQMSMQNAVQEAGRFASTGNHLPDPKNPGQSLTRVNSIIAVAQQAAMGANMSNIQVSSLNGGAGSAGGPGDTVTVAVTTNLKLICPAIAAFFPNGTYQFTSSVTFKNEPFPPNNTN